MKSKLDSIKEFTNDDELKAFCKQTWGDYLQNLDDVVKGKLLTIQNHGLTEGLHDDEIISLYGSELWKFPPVPIDIIVYRGGKMSIQGRPFLSASFYKDTAIHFAHHKKLNLHPIIIRKGSCVLPSLYLYGDFSFPEQEIVLDVSCLHKRIEYYDYFKKQTNLS